MADRPKPRVFKAPLIPGVGSAIYFGTELADYNNIVPEEDQGLGDFLGFMLRRLLGLPHPNAVYPEDEPHDVPKIHLRITPGLGPGLTFGEEMTAPENEGAPLFFTLENTLREMLGLPTHYYSPPVPEYLYQHIPTLEELDGPRTMTMTMAPLRPDPLEVFNTLTLFGIEPEEERQFTIRPYGGVDPYASLTPVSGDTTPVIVMRRSQQQSVQMRNRVDVENVQPLYFNPPEGRGFAPVPSMVLAGAGFR